MELANLPGQFADQTFYAAHFMDALIWKPYLQWVCQQHGFDCRQIKPGLPGSYPTFIIEVDAAGVQSGTQYIVVKFFGPLFDGAGSFLIEQAVANTLAERALPVHSPFILALGRLSAEWSYLIFEYIPGVSIGVVREQLSAEAWMTLADQMGTFMRALHTATANGQPIIPVQEYTRGWEEFVDFLEKQRCQCATNHQQWKDLPPHLIEQLPAYLPPVDELLDLSASPHLIHADLTADHVLGRQTNHDWQTLAIIDWGDARVGNILYELVALHVDLFQADRHLLQRCLETYHLPTFYQPDFPRKALSMLLLHQFPMPVQIIAPHQQVASLNELAERLFGMEVAG